MTRTTVPAVVNGSTTIQSVTDALTNNDTQNAADIQALATGKAVPTSGLNSLTGYYHATGYSGIDASGNSDSTSGINSFINALPAGATGYFGPGKYKVTSTLTTPKKGCTILGSGDGKSTSGGGTTFSFQPSSGDVMISNPAYVNFRDFQCLFPNNNTASAQSKFFELNGTFCCVWDNITFQGQHNAAGDAFGSSQSNWGTGIHFLGNAGDSQITDCFFLNMGRALVCDSIQNYMKGGKFGYCYIGIDIPDKADGGVGGNGGIVVSDVTFVTGGGSIGHPNGWTPAHFQIRSAGNGVGQSAISRCWFEGATTSINITGGGCNMFSVMQSKVSAYGTCIYDHSGTYHTFLGVQTGQGSTSYDVSVPVFAAGLTSNQSGDGQFSGGRIIPSTFPSGSIVEGTPR